MTPGRTVLCRRVELVRFCRPASCYRWFRLGRLNILPVVSITMGFISKMSIPGQRTTMSLADPEGGEKIFIRVAGQVDAEEIFLIHRDSVDNLCHGYYTSEQISMWMDGRSPATYHEAIAKKRIFIADDSRGAVGFVEYAPGEIVKLFVRGTSAKRGVGDLLMKIALCKACEGGISKVRVESTRNAQSFYERYGFREDGEGIFSRGGSGVSIEIIKLFLDI